MLWASEELDRTFGVIADFEGNPVPNAHAYGWLCVAHKRAQRCTVAVPVVACIAGMSVTHFLPFSIGSFSAFPGRSQV
jgi:hypothetical protein